MRNFFTVLLMFVTTQVGADWARIATGGGGTITFYIDDSSILRIGNLRQARELVDRTTPDSNGMLSMQGLLEYDCKEEKSRWSSETWYSGNMGAGRILRNDTSIREWNHVLQGKTGNTLLRYVCSH